MISFIPGIIGIAVLIYLALIFESTSFALAAYGLAVLCVLSFILLMVMKWMVSVRLSIPINIGERDKKLSMLVHINNKSFFPFPKLKFKIEYGIAVKKSRKSVWLTADDIMRGRSEKTFRLEIAQAGSYEFTLKKVKVYDMTGMFCLCRRFDSSAYAIVLPEISQMPITLGGGVRNFFGDAMGYDEVRPGDSPDEVFDVREFRNGDKIQSIHWKLTARLDELMVKEHSLPKACPVVILLQPGSSGIPGVPEWAAAISYSLMDLKCPHYAAWYSRTRKDVLRVRVDNEESYYLFISSYMQDDAPEGPKDLLARYRDKYRGEQYLHVLQPIDKKTLLHNNEVFKTEKIEEMELLLK